MSDLASVKAAVKAWERSFKATHKRDPTKEDIKNDPGRIGEQYALYRKLSKLSSESQRSSSSGSQRPDSFRIVPSNGYPTTPTPPTRHRSVSRSSSRPTASSVEANRCLPSSQAGPSTPSRLITPKKSRPYSGPIHDPNPINPFAVTPVKTPASHLGSAGMFSTDRTASSSSPFIHASSPRKLRQVLEANSLRKVREREGLEEITPRTRARKRLRGEAVADTPVKDRPVRRKRGERRPTTEASSDAVSKGKGKLPLEDEFGPSPMRPEVDKTFTALFDEPDEGSEVVGLEDIRSRSSVMMGLFGRATVEIKKKPQIGEESPAPSLPLPVTEAAETVVIDAEELAHTPQRPCKVISFSDDEQDEWDPEGGHVTHQVVITGTRRQVCKPRDSLSDGTDGDDDGLDTPELYDNITEETSHTSIHPSSPPPLLSLLSIQSPRAKTTITEMRYKAIFDPSQAARLRAMKRGQEVYISGQGVDRDGDMEEENEVEGDDDWEEEPEGWKEAGIADEDW
ncbi:hypothetical protein BD324DRAFT_639049 [Kockovaella imperatae]|uniref:DNA replication regulator SLD2 n=1 Tax=Kockovaella imperatae TaxID=4999 RepID=A0A1Y1U6M8_9TREE|nr:hypothetical protein BD324DRAFT_639049 [Kockovaella imperatae]ORX33652.1 hypothetical protein BD324DRAFT_639049 [Kockovaella imperatae]